MPEGTELCSKAKKLKSSYEFFYLIFNNSNAGFSPFSTKQDSLQKSSPVTFEGYMYGALFSSKNYFQKSGGFEISKSGLQIDNGLQTNW